ncbi:uncharacterized protein [Typha angustifolia]|uniref:uncharacterized protein n=1 Tax=Typha angustifolia TaxID=59011 RepID=UPI003C30145F
MSHYVALVSHVLGIRSWILEEVFMMRSTNDSQLKQKAAADEEHAECCVCLSRYEEGEVIRKLPCHHLFHRECVDRWLALHRRTCPLCRVDIDGQLVSGPEEQLSDDLVIWFSSFLVPGF